VAQKISVSRKNISQGFAKMCKGIKRNGRCGSESPYTCEEVSDKLIFLPRLQIANRIMCFKGRKGRLYSFGYDFLHNIAANCQPREVFLDKKNAILRLQMMEKLLPF